MRTKPGIQPSGAGALFVVGADGGRAERITPWGSAFLDQAWSPDGRWITFERPYGELYLVRPDASDLHAIPVQLPTGAGAETPSWSAVGRWIVFSFMRKADRTSSPCARMVRACGGSPRQPRATSPRLTGLHNAPFRRRPNFSPVSRRRPDPPWRCACWTPSAAPVPTTSSCATRWPAEPDPARVTRRRTRRGDGARAATPRLRRDPSVRGRGSGSSP